MSVRKFQFDEVVALLAAQQKRGPELFEKHMRAAFRSGALQFWYPDGTPRICEPARPDDAFGDEYYLGLSLEHTTAAAVNRWLEHWGAEYRFEVEATPPAVPARNRTAQQRDLILKTVRELGHDPHALPTAPGGSRGVRAEVRDRVKGNELFTAPSSFPTAWKELRRMGGLREVK